MAWLSGWNYRQSITIPSSGWSLSGNLTNQPVKVAVPSSNTAFWAGVKADGTDVRFTASDGSTLLDFEIEKFDNTADDATYHVKVASLLSASDTTIYVYYGNSGASSGENINGTWDSNYKAVYHLSQNKAAGAFADSTSNANNGTNTGTTDVAGKIDRGRNFLQSSAQCITVADADSLSFGNGTTDTALTIEAWVKMTDATGFRIAYKANGSSGLDEYGFTTSGSDKLFLALYDNIASVNIAKTIDTAFTADEGTWVHVAATYSGSGAHSGITMYKNGISVAATGSSAGTYTAMENTTQPLHIGHYNSGGSPLYANGDMDEITISAVARSADWIKARYNSATGTWTFGGEEGIVATTAALTLTAYAAQIGLSTNITATTASLTATTYAADINLNKSVTATTASLTLTTYKAFVAPLIMNTASLTLTAYSATVNASTNVVASTASCTLTTYSATVDLTWNVAATTASMTITTYAATVDFVSGQATTLSVGNFPQGATVEYKIHDAISGLLQDWTSIGVNEVQGPSKSAYYFTTSVIGITTGTSGVVYWRTSDLEYEASEAYDFVNIGLTLSTALAGGIAKESSVQTRLAASNYVDHTIDIAAIPTLSEIEASDILAKQATLITKASQASVDSIPTNPLLALDYIAPDNVTIAANSSALASKPSLAQMEASNILAKEATVNTRLAATDYVAPDNANILVIKAMMDLIYKMEKGKLVQTDNINGTKTYTYYEDDAELIKIIEFLVDSTGKIRYIGTE